MSDSMSSGLAALPPDRARQIDGVCNRFEAAWKAGPPPRIDDFLDGWTEPERSLLLRELVLLDGDYRRQRGEAPATPTNDGEVTGTYLGTSPLPAVPGYRVLREIARGGMGRVLAAHDLTLDRDVALKILLPGANADRFVRESKITARLSHPGIPPVHALGTLADGSPFLAMKLIAGQTLAVEMKTADRPRLLQAFTQVCQAVGFAHSRGVIHRDLKPANVMVGAFGEVQVMDWGLAKDLTSREVADEPRSSEAQTIPVVGTDANQTTDCRAPGESTDDQTQAGTVLGTPAYMAPEQARGEAADARADVFALGGILCAILTGKPPFSGKSMREVIQRAGAADLAEAHARLDDSGLDADLVALCRHCLRPVPADRPANGQAVADGLTAYLHGVQERLRAAELQRAGAESRAIEAQARAHSERRARRLLLGLAASVLLGAGVASVLAVRSYWQAQAEKEARAAAETSERTANNRLIQIKKSNDILGSLFQDLDPHEGGQGGTSLRVQLAARMDRATQELEGNAIGDPIEVARLQMTLGQCQRGLGQTDKAIELLTRARETLTAELPPNHLDTLTCINALALAYTDKGDTDRAIPLFAELVRQFRQQLGAEDRHTSTAMNNLALAHHQAWHLEVAIDLFAEALRYQQVNPGPKDRVTLGTMNNLAMAYRDAGKPELAAPLLEEAFRLRSEVLSPEHADTVGSKNNLALAYLDARVSDRAIPLFKEVVLQFRKDLGPQNPSTSTAMNNLALAYLQTGKRENREQAITLLVEVLKQQQVNPGPQHPSTLNTLNNLAMAYRDSKQLDRATPLLEETLELRKNVRSPNHMDTLVSTNNLALAYQDAGQHEKALVLLKDVVREFSKQLGPTHASTLQVTGNLVTSYVVTRHPEAAPLLRELVALRRGKQPPDPPALAGNLAQLAMILLEAKEYLEAETVLRECLAIRENREPDAWTTFNTRALLGGALLGRKQYADAEQLLLQGYEGMKQRESEIPPAARVRLVEALERIVQLYEATGKKGKAEEWHPRLAEAKKAAAKKSGP